MKTFFLIICISLIYSCSKEKDSLFKSTGNVERDVQSFLELKNNVKYSCVNDVKVFKEKFLSRTSQEISKEVVDLNTLLVILENLRQKVKDEIVSSTNSDCTNSLIDLYDTNLVFIESLRFELLYSKYVLPSQEELTKILKRGDVLLYRLVYGDRFIEPESFSHRFTKIAVVKKVTEKSIEIFHPYRDQNVQTLEELYEKNKDKPFGRLNIYRPNEGDLFVKKLEENIGSNTFASTFFTAADGDSFLSRVEKALVDSNHEKIAFSLILDKEKKRNLQLEKMKFSSYLEFNPSLTLVNEFITPLTPWVHLVDSFISYMYKIRENSKFVYIFRQRFMNEKKNIEKEVSNRSKEEVRQLTIWKTYGHFIDEAIKLSMPLNQKLLKNHTKKELEDFFMDLNYPVLSHQ